MTPEPRAFRSARSGSIRRPTALPPTMPGAELEQARRDYVGLFVRAGELAGRVRELEAAVDEAVDHDRKKLAVALPKRRQTATRLL